MNATTDQSKSEGMPLAAPTTRRLDRYKTDRRKSTYSRHRRLCCQCMPRPPPATRPRPVLLVLYRSSRFEYCFCVHHQLCLMSLKGGQKACPSRKAEQQNSTKTNKAKKTSSLAKKNCLLYTSPSPRDRQKSRMPSSA